MNGTRTSGWRVRRRAIAALSACAVVGGCLAGATTANAADGDLAGCVTGSTVSGLLASTAGAVECVVSSATPTTTAPTTSMTSTTAPTAEVTAPTPDTTASEPVATTAPTTTAPTTRTTTESTGGGSLQTVRLVKTTSTVYPSATGWSRSVVRFSVRGLTAARTGVGITGEAVLRRGTHVVRTWRIGAATTTLTWNGKEGSKVEPGLYRLTATAWSSDGARAVSTSSVRVSAKRFVTRTMSVRTRDLAKARTDTLPIAVVKGFRYGEVTLRVHTTAKVTGTARLVISGPYGNRFSIPLRDGKHVTARKVLPMDFTSAVFHHRWKKGAAKLVDLYTVFTFKELV